MLTFYKPQEATVKQVKELCFRDDGHLRFFCQMGPTYKAMMEGTEEIEIIGRVYTNGILTFDSSLLLGKSLGTDGPVGQHISPIDKRKQILHKNLSDTSIIHRMSLIYFIECEEYNNFLEKVTKLELLTPYRAVKYLQKHEDIIVEQLNLVKLAIRKQRDKMDKLKSYTVHHR